MPGVRFFLIALQTLLTFNFTLAQKTTNSLPKNHFGLMAGMSFPGFGFKNTYNNNFGQTDNGFSFGIEYTRQIDSGIFFIGQYRYNSNSIIHSSLSTHFTDPYGNELPGTVAVIGDWMMHSAMIGIGSLIPLDSKGIWYIQPKALIGFTSVTTPNISATAQYLDTVSFKHVVLSQKTGELHDTQLSYAAGCSFIARTGNITWNLEADYLGSSFSATMPLSDKRTHQTLGNTTINQRIHLLQLKAGLGFVF